jgi:hypothetical protein
MKMEEEKIRSVKHLLSMKEKIMSRKEVESLKEKLVKQD